MTIRASLRVTGEQHVRACEIARIGAGMIWTILPSAQAREQAGTINSLETNKNDP
jgi:hypothetical protein